MMMRHVVHFEQMVQLAFGCLLMHVSAHSMGTWLLSDTSFGHTYPPIYPSIYSPIYLCIYSPALGIWATSTSWRLRLPLVSFMQITSCAMYLIHSSTSSINHIHPSIHWMPHYTCIWLNLYVSPIHLMLCISFIHPPHPSIHFIHLSHPFHLSIHGMSHNTSIWLYLYVSPIDLLNVSSILCIQIKRGKSGWRWSRTSQVPIALKLTLHRSIYESSTTITLSMQVAIHLTRTTRKRNGRAPKLLRILITKRRRRRTMMRRMKRICWRH